MGTSGVYGQATEKSLAFAYVGPDVVDGLEVVILGERPKLTLMDERAWDPTNARQRGTALA